MLEMSRDAVAVGEKQLVSCAAEQSKYCSICTLTLDLCGDLPFTSWGRWQCLCGGAGGLNGCYAACGCGTEYRCEFRERFFRRRFKIALEGPNRIKKRIALKMGGLG